MRATPKALPKTWRYLLPCAPRVGCLSQVCGYWDGSWICLSAEAVLTCSHLFDPLMEVFQDRLIDFFHFRALLFTCNHFPMSYQPRKLPLLARIAWHSSGIISQCTTFVLSVDCSTLCEDCRLHLDLHSLFLPLTPLDKTKPHLCHSVKLVLTKYLLILQKDSTFFKKQYLLSSWWPEATAHYLWLLFLPCLSACISLLI